MPHRVNLTDRQIELLRWIADGCPDGVMSDESHRISAAALRNRGLATTSGRGASWKARITPAGVAYLAGLDEHPAQAPAKLDRARAGADRPAVNAANGSDGRRAARPRPHGVAQDFRERRERHEVSRAQLERAARLVGELAAEFESRGWAVAPSTQSENEFGLTDWSSAKDGHLTVDVGGQRFWIRVQEEGVGTRGALEDDDSVTYDRDGTGRLKLELRWGEWYTRQQTRWVDRDGALLEDRLTDVVREIESRSADAQRAVEEKRARAERLNADQQAQASARQSEWQEHMARARERYAEAARTAELERQASAWEQATRVRAYCDALAKAHPEDAQTAAWIAWARRYADELDPVRRRQKLPATDEPSAAELQPYMPEGWTATGP